MPDSETTLAEAVLEFRRDRREFLPPEIFSEPAWDLLLELFVADARGQRLTARQVCGRCNTPLPVMARWLKYLTAIDLVIGDGNGDLDDQLTLSAKALLNIESALNRLRMLQDRVADAVTDSPRGHRPTPV